MTIVFLIGALALLYGAYSLGVYRGFSRGYFTALFDLSIGETEEYVEALAEDGETPAPPTNPEWQNAYLDIFGGRIDAGRRRRN